jgi:hypothetical protein
MGCNHFGNPKKHLSKIFFEEKGISMVVEMELHCKTDFD